MASVATQKNGLRYIQYLDASGLRKTIRLGKLNLRSAESVCHYVESLISAQAVGSPPDRATLAWLEGITDELRKRLASAGLIAAPVRSEMKAFLDEYILSRQDVKPATREIWSQPCRNLVEFFGADRPLQTITAGGMLPASLSGSARRSSPPRP